MTLNDLEWPLFYVSEYDHFAHFVDELHCFDCVMYPAVFVL